MTYPRRQNETSETTTNQLPIIIRRKNVSKGKYSVQQSEFLPFPYYNHDGLQNRWCLV